MINPGKIIFALCVFLFLAHRSFAADLTAELDRDKVAPDEQVTLSVKASDGKISPSSLPKAEGLDIQFAGSSYQMVYNNGNMWRGTVLNYVIRPQREGTLTIPPIGVTVDGVQKFTKPMKIQVSQSFARRSPFSGMFPGFPDFPDPFGDMAPVRQAQIAGRVEIPKRTLYVGELVPVQYRVVADTGDPAVITGIREVSAFTGFLVKDLSFDENKNLKQEDRFTYLIVPQSAGTFQIYGGTYTAGIRGGFGDSLIRFPKDTITVRDLPSVGRPANFSGTVGSFAVESDLADMTCRAFEEKRFTVTVKGEGNFMGLSHPSFESVPDSVRILYEDGTEQTDVVNGTLKGEKTFAVTIIPEAEGSFRLGSLSLVYFNPGTGSYNVARTSSVKLTVSGVAEKKVTVDKSSTGTSPLLWLGTGVLILALFVSGIILYERRKYGIVTEAATDVSSSDGESVVRKRNSARELLHSLNRTVDPSEFFRIAERILEEVRSASGDDLGAEQLRQEILAVRYSGGTPDSSMMKKFAERITKVVNSAN